MTVIEGHSVPAPNPPRKHHYIPEFYLRLWTSDVDGRLCQIARYPKFRYGVKRRAPGGVGFKYDLYTIPGLPPDQAAMLERGFFQIADDRAAVAQAQLLQGVTVLSPELRSAWVRFLLSLFQRNPEKVEWIARVWRVLHAEAHVAAEAESAVQGVPYAPLNEEQMTRSRNVSAARVLQTLIELENTGTHMLNMEWTVLQLTEYPRLLTSDRPVVMTNGLQSPHAHICLSLGPSKLFVAANHSGTINFIKAMGAKRLSRKFNDQVVRNAHRYVYGRDDNLFEFVRARLGRQPAQFIASRELKRRFPPSLELD